MFQEELTLIKQVNQKSVCFVITVYKLQPYLCNICHAVSMMAYKLENIVILNAKGVGYRCILVVLVGMRLLIG